MTYFIQNQVQERGNVPFQASEGWQAETSMKFSQMNDFYL